MNIEFLGVILLIIICLNHIAMHIRTTSLFSILNLLITLNKTYLLQLISIWLMSMIILFLSQKITLKLLASKIWNNLILGMELRNMNLKLPQVVMKIWQISTIMTLMDMTQVKTQYQQRTWPKSLRYNLETLVC